MTGPADDLQELGESWPGAPKLRFRKTGHQESFLSLPLLFLFCFFSPSLLSIPFSTAFWKNCGLEIRLPTFDLTALGSLLRGPSCRSQQNCEKEKKNSRCCRLLCRQRAGPAVWLRRESIYILGMPRSWLGLSCTVLCEHGQWKVWSPGQKV